MAYPTGVKLGGRRAGVPNKDRTEIVTMLREAAKKLTGKGDYDPLTALLELALDKTNDLKGIDRVRCHEALAEYSHSKRKAIEVTGHLTGEQTVNVYKWADDEETIDRQIALMSPDE